VEFIMLYSLDVLNNNSNTIRPEPPTLHWATVSKG